ncbi:MAG: DUF721 domain-containing protein [Gammaproteobacteria bacterium]|nr:DUF721 domain-containing protein [Gammaproteobacteria bacterium]
MATHPDILMAASRRNSPATVHSLLVRRDGPLSGLNSRAEELSRLDDLLSALLPGAVAQHVRACALHGNTLVLQTDSPVWSTRLRMAQPQLLAAFQHHDRIANITSLRITVSAPAIEDQRAGPTPRLSAPAAEFLAKCADSQTDPALRAALTRLSRRT